MRGNDLKLEKNRPKYNLHKYFLTNWVVNISVKVSDSSKCNGGTT